MKKYHVPFKYLPTKIPIITPIVGYLLYDKFKEYIPEWALAIIIFVYCFFWILSVITFFRQEAFDLDKPVSNNTEANKTKENRFMTKLEIAIKESQNKNK